MENLHEPSSSTCNDDILEKNQPAKFRLARCRASRAGFSATLSIKVEEDLGVHSEVAEGEGEDNEETLSTADDESIRSLESETDSSKASTSGEDTKIPHSKSSPHHWPGFFKLLRKGSAKTAMHLQTFPAISVPKLRRRTSKRVRDTMVPAALDVEFCRLKASWKNFTLSELQAATSNFCRENLIGEGGYSEVYKGQMEDGNFVAIKRLTRGNPEEMTADFLHELGIIVHVNHPNIAKLIGYGVEGGMHLVLQLSPHGSLASLLNGSKEKLSWDVRYKIALGTAEGLMYLHEACQRRIIHKDIKAANILLTEEFEPQISDFGLAKWLPGQWTHHVESSFEGTFGYLPPEFFMHGIVDEKTDVYAYGVLLLELITGRLALDNSHKSLVMWAKPLLAKNSIVELVDPYIANAAYDSNQMDLVVLMASLCVDQSSIQRPPMSQIVKILRGDDDHSLEMAKQCRRRVLQRTYSAELLDAEDYNSTKYLNDMSRQMQIEMEL